MPNTIAYPADHPLMAAYISTHGVIVKSPSSFAREQIKKYFREHFSLELDPDATRIVTLTFNTSPIPCPATLLSALTLTEATLRHYRKHFGWLNGIGPVAPYRDGGIAMRLVDKLPTGVPVHLVEGLYRDSTPQVYDASTHINVRPEAFKAFVKDIDLRKRYRAYLNTFWSANARYYPVLARAAFIKAVFIQAAENSLGEADRLLALAAAGLPAVQQWTELTPDHMQATATADAHLHIAPLKIHRYTSTDILLIRDMRHPRVLLYIPGNSSPIHGFADEHAMADWLAAQCREPRKRAALEMHFRERDDHDGLFVSGLHTTLEGVAAYPHWLSYDSGAWPPRHLIHAGKTISGDPFVFLRRQMQQRLTSDAGSLIRTSADALLNGLSEGLSRSLLVTGVIALVVPEAIPFIVGLSVTLIGTGTAQIVRGNSLEQRQQGLQRVEFGLFNAVPLAAGELMGAAAGVEATVDRVESSVTLVQPPVLAPLKLTHEPPGLASLSPSLRQSLRAFEAPSARAQGQPTIPGPNGMLDIHHADGRYFLAIHDKAYEVRWENAARQWRIISPDGKGEVGPFVRQLPDDQWDIDKGRLKGGMDNGPAVPVGEAAASGPSLDERVTALYPGFSQQQIAEFLADLRGTGLSLEVQLTRLATDYQALEQSLERWLNGPLNWGPRIDGVAISVSREARSRAADIIKRCWQRQTPVEGLAARHIDGYMLNLASIPVGDLPPLPGDFSHVTAINLSGTFTSHLSASALIIKCPNLRWLTLEHNFLERVPDGIRGLSQLTRLSLANNRIELSLDMMSTLRTLPRLKQLDLSFNPLGPLLDVSSMSELINLLLRHTGIDALPVGVCDLPNLLALDLRNNRMTILPEAFFQRERLLQHSLLDGNPLTPIARGRLAVLRVPLVEQPQGGSLDFWLEHTPQAQRARRRDIWDLLWTQEHATDFFEVIARQQGSADFEIDPQGVSDRVWQVLEAGAQDQALRTRLIGMAAHPQTCADGAAVMFSNMELEVLVSRARAQAVAGGEGQSLLKLLRGLYRLEEVDAIARRDAAARVDFVEDVEVILAYRTRLASRLELPINTRRMIYGDVADVSLQVITRTGQIVLGNETSARLAEFALGREFWVDYLERQYADQFVLCRQPTADQMEALDERLAKESLTDAAYKEAADALMRQRREDEQGLMKRLTEGELAKAAR
ncbi:NEL-type E3 ubiquitin ligase domain-containing protein [Pseudomonas sp. Pseusp122]|uniref:NEL-type E3 ubiquitin ligase domain-containing protein n=1 Tax=unclassified Pseudomonas TaxID=196821 RepID=UPI0039A4DAF5